MRLGCNSLVSYYAVLLSRVLEVNFNRLLQKERDSEKAADKDSSEQTTGEAKLNETTKEGAKAEA